MLGLGGSSRDTSLAWTSHSPASGQAPAAWVGVVAMASSKLALARQVEFDFDFSTGFNLTPVALHLSHRWEGSTGFGQTRDETLDGIVE